METMAPDRPDAQKSLWSELFPALREHLHRAKLIIYSTFLVAAVVQILIRERLPEVHPPWRWIGGVVMVVLFAVLVIPPVLLVIRVRRARKAESHEARS